MIHGMIYTVTLSVYHRMCPLIDCLFHFLFSVLLQDIRDKRNSKIRSGYKGINTMTSHLNLHNISSLELNRIRNYSCSLLALYEDVQNGKEIQNGNVPAAMDQDPDFFGSESTPNSMQSLESDNSRSRLMRRIRMQIDE